MNPMKFLPLHFVKRANIIACRLGTRKEKSLLISQIGVSGRNRTGFEPTTTKL